MTVPVQHLSPRRVQPRSKRRPPAINIGTLNLQRGRHDGLLEGARAADVARFDIILFTEVKITDDIYSKYQFDYDICCSRARSKHQGGVAFASRRDAPNWHLESMQRHGPNVLSTLLTFGQRQIPLIGVYLPPTSLDDLPFFEEALDRFPALEPIILGDLNVDLNDQTSQRCQQVATLLAAHGLVDMVAQFRQRSHHRHRTTWRQKVNGRLRRSRCDYILGHDRRLFENAGIRQLRHVTTDHLAIRARILSVPTKSHQAYLRGRRTFPVAAIIGPNTWAGHLLDKAVAQATPRPPNPARVYKQWISPPTLQLIDCRAGLSANDRSQTRRRQLSRQIRQALKQDRAQRAADAGEEIMQHVTGGNMTGAWQVAKRWYRQVTHRPPKPSRMDLVKLTNDFRNLLTSEQSPGAPIPVLVEPANVNDEPPSSEEIGAAVMALRRRKATGQCKLRAEDLQEWFREAHPLDEDTPPILTRWQVLVDLITHIWVTGDVPEKMAWCILALIPKGAAEFRGIGLLHIIQKLLEVIIQRRVAAVVQFHDMVHGFCAHRGTGTACLELKLCQELASAQQCPLFLIFVDLRKAYDTVDRRRAMTIFAQYGLGPRMRRIIKNFWDRQVVVARQSTFFGPAFKSSRGLVQGGPFSPIAFNIVMDNIICYWLSLAIDDNGLAAAHGLGMQVGQRLGLWYADDQTIGARDATWLQGAIDLLSGVCRRAGLTVNLAKTKAMSCLPGPIRSCLSAPAYTRRVTGLGGSYRERLRTRTHCPECGINLAVSSLADHRRRQHFVEPEVNWNQVAIGNNAAVPQLYTISFPKVLRDVQCPVDGCECRPRSHSGMRSHMLHRHWQDTIRIEEESMYPYPCCPRCDLQVPPQHLHNRHFNSVACARGADRKRQRLADERAFAAQSQTFTLRGSALAQTTQQRHLGRIVSVQNSDWLTIYHNLKRARAKWCMLTRVLTKEGASTKTKGLFYLAVVLSVLLYGAETWVTTPAMLRTLDGFHHRIVRRITGMLPVRMAGGGWDYPPINEALELIAIPPIRALLQHIHQRAVEYIVERPIFQLCQDAPRLSGSPSRRLRWWEQSTVICGLESAQVAGGALEDGVLEDGDLDDGI